MEIKVLGTGCAGCKALHATLRIDATIVKEEDMMNIMAYNVLRLPALVIDGKVVSSGKRLSLSEVKTMLQS